MYYVRVRCKDKEEFISKIEMMISEWEGMLKVDGRRREYEDVIWGAHRILSFLDIEYKENNDVI